MFWLNGSDINNTYSLHISNVNPPPPLSLCRSLVRLLGGLYCGLATRSGNIDLPIGSLRSVGSGGYYWLSTAYPDVNNAYHLGFLSTDTYPSNDYARWLGLSRRYSRPSILPVAGD